MNDLLRRAMFDAGLDEERLAAELNVDPKTVRRWLEGRQPYSRHRWALAELLGVDEFVLWPQLRAARVARSRPREMTAVYPDRQTVPRARWLDLFDAAQHRVDVLDYSALFLAEDEELMRLLRRKAADGVRLRLALGHPEPPHVTEHPNEDARQISPEEIRRALALYGPLIEDGYAEIRLHSDVLYSSIYHADDQVFVNQHVFGFQAAQSPILHLSRTSGSGMYSAYVDSFEQIWEISEPFSP